jgi:hypothetical protein
MMGDHRSMISNLYYWISRHEFDNAGPPLLLAGNLLCACYANATIHDPKRER